MAVGCWGVGTGMLILPDSAMYYAHCIVGLEFEIDFMSCVHYPLDRIVILIVLG